MAKTYLFWEPLSDNILQERDESGALVAEYAAEPGLYGNVISQNRGILVSQLHYDAIGSTLAITDNNQQISDTKSYSAFGESTETMGSTALPFQFIGKRGYYIDVERGTIRVRRRELWQSTGRWTAVDPMHDNGRSAYLYVGNNPVIALDPSGLWTKDETDVYYTNDPRDTFESLVRLVAPQLNAKKNRVCVIPLRLVDADNWKNEKVTLCATYGVHNIVDALPVGPAVLASVGRDLNGYIASASTFFGVPNDRRHLSRAQFATLVRTSASSGGTPLDSVTVIGHSWARQDAIGGSNGMRLVLPFTLADLIEEARKDGIHGLWGWQGDLNKARGLKMAPGCWFSAGFADVWLVGCRTRGFAQEWANSVLRFGAHATGSNEATWAYEGGMGWGKVSGGILQPDPPAGKAGSPEEYLVRFLGKKPGWDTYQGKN